MKTINGFFHYFSKGELALWSGSSFTIVIAFCLFDRSNYATLLASLIGVTSLILTAKGNPFGQFFMVIFSLIYGMISFTFSYYGEMFTYLGMTMPMAILALICWIRNPYNENKTEVKINHISQKEWCYIFILTAFVTIGFYFVLEYFHTANIFPSTISVTTSFIAVYLTFRRSPYYAVGYAVNDVVLIILWSLATIENLSYLSVIVCFFAFLVNDIYGFLNWIRMGKRQAENAVTP